MSSLLRGAALAAGLAVALPAPAAKAEEIKLEVGRQLNLCVPVNDTESASLGINLKRVLPGGVGCEFDVQIHTLGGSQIGASSPIVPRGQALTLNIVELINRDVTGAVRAACIGGGALVNTGTSGAER